MFKRLLLLVAALFVAGFALALPAAAHVTVTSGDATQGGYGVLTFRVPTESATASTTKLTVQFPTDTPLASVGVQPMQGWNEEATKSKLAKPIKTDDGDVTEAVTQVTWTAKPGFALKPGQFQQFFVQAGPLPDKPSISFKALQTYSDGSVVKWIETAAPGSSAEPEHPAPTLKLAAANETAAIPAGAPDSGTATTTASSDSSSSSDTGPVVLSIIALVLAAAALGLAVVGRTRRSRS